MAKHIPAFLLLLLTATAAPADDTLVAEWRNPPDAARPHTWWHWMNGNVTKKGITAELWNNIPGNKEIRWMQGSQHGYQPPPYEGRDTVVGF